MIEMSKLIEELGLRGADDWIGVWELPDIVQCTLPEAPSRDLNNISIALVQEALSRGLIEIGSLEYASAVAGVMSQKLKFVPWPGSQTETVLRLRREWEGLGRQPELGEVGWINWK